MIQRHVVLFAGFFVAAVMSGCATSRSEISLATPTASPTSGTAGKPIVLRQVRDERQFEQAPRDPGIPSLGFEGSAQASAETKSRAIGRKRNTYGQALGDVLLQPGQTVEGVVRANVSAALEQAGYRVVPEQGAPASTPSIDVRIKRFWSWLQPGFWAITLHTAIDTDFSISGRPEAIAVSVKTQEGLQLATDGNWIEVVGKALTAYRTEATGKLPPAR